MRHSFPPSMDGVQEMSTCPIRVQQGFALILSMGTFGTSLSGALQSGIVNRLPLALFCGILGFIEAMVLIRTVRRMKSSLAEKDFPPAIKLPVLAILILLMASNSAALLHYQTGMIKTFLLESTPWLVVFLAIILGSMLLSMNGIRPLARTVQVALWIGWIPLGILIAVGLIQMDFGELPTLWQWEPSTLLIEASSAFPGVFCYLPLLFFWDQVDEAADRKIPWALLVLGVTGLCLLAVCTGLFTLAGMDLLSYPVGEIARALRISSYSLLERLDMLMVAVRIILTVLALALNLWGIAQALQGMLGKKAAVLSCLLAPSLLLAATYTFRLWQSYRGFLALLSLGALLLLWIDLWRKP